MVNFADRDATEEDLRELKALLDEAAGVDDSFPAQRFDGRGIVICAGGARMFTCAWVAIALLRQNLGCTLPIEVWHLGPEEMGPAMRSLLEKLGVETVDAFEVAKRYPVRRLGGWELKPYALMHSRFSEVLMLDADNVPVRDPAFLFDCAEYRETGALFWPDIVRIAPDNAIWEVSGLPYRDGASFESGQMVVDKARNWRALALTHWMNQHSDAFYRILHGDKDTFFVAWAKLALPYHLIRHRPKMLELTMCQRDPDGAVLFQHRNGAKWVLDGTNPRIAGFRLEAECRALLVQLSHLWDGRVFNPPPRSPACQRLEAELAEIRHFTMIRVSSDERAIELLPDHRIRSNIRLEGYWYLDNGPDEPEMRIERDGVRICALRRSPDGIWRGSWLQAPGMPVELIPAAQNGGAEPTEEIMPQDVLRVLNRILELSAKLPSDRETARDVAGALRILAALDPAVVTCLRATLATGPADSARMRVIGGVLNGIAESGPITSGANWLRAYFGTGYERV